MIPESYTPAAAQALAHWGASAEMNPIETVMWRAEAEPRLRSTVLSVEILDCVPDWDRVVAAHEWGIATIPRARQRVVEPPFALGRPTWVDDDDFDLDRHLRRLALPEPGSMRQLLDLARSIATTPFDRAHPPWEMTLVEGLEGGRSAYISKLHHSATDGLGGMQLVALGRSRRRDHTPDKPVVATPSTNRSRSSTPLGLLRSQLTAAVSSAPARGRRHLEDAMSFLQRSWEDPAAPLEDAVRYVSSLQRIIGESPAPGSPLLAGRSGSWHFEAHEVPLQGLKAAAKSVGGSLNDAYIAALLGAFRRYHHELGADPATMPVAFPISLRRGDDPLGGNRFAGARLAGPVGEADPAERMRRIRRAVLQARDEPAIDALDRLSGTLVSVPTPLLTKVLLGLGQDNDLQASNVPGVPFPVYLAGARVLRMFPFGPLPGCAAMAAMVSHDGTCCIGLNVDPAAVADADLFAECLVDGFDEVLAVGR